MEYKIGQLNWNESSRPVRNRHVPQIDRIRRQQWIRQAEGYLDLVMCLEDRWPLSQDLVDSMTSRALAKLQKLGATSGRKSHVYFLQGQAYRVRREYENAISAFWTSLETDSENIHTHLGLAWCYKRLNEIDLAIESLTRAFELDPANPVISYNLACYWSLQGNVSQCCEFLIRAFELEEHFREFVDQERDFDPVRNHPHFQSITSVVA